MVFSRLGILNVFSTDDIFNLYEGFNQVINSSEVEENLY